MGYYPPETIDRQVWEVEDLKAKVEALTARVETLEKERLRDADND